MNKKEILAFSVALVLVLVFLFGVVYAFCGHDNTARKIVKESNNNEASLIIDSSVKATTTNDINETSTTSVSLEQENLVDEKYKDWKTYRSEKYGFEIKYPENWKIGRYNMKDETKFFASKNYINKFGHRGDAGQISISFFQKNNQIFNDWEKRYLENIAPMGCEKKEQEKIDSLVATSYYCYNHVTAFDIRVIEVDNFFVSIVTGSAIDFDRQQLQFDYEEAIQKMIEWFIFVK